MSFITNNKSKAFILYLFGFFFFQHHQFLLMNLKMGFKRVKKYNGMTIRDERVIASEIWL